MKVLIAVGGGGHFSPALAVIEQMPNDWQIVLVGRKYAFEGDQALSFEYQTAQQLHLPFAELTTGRLQRKFTRHTVTSLLKMPKGMTQAYGIFKKHKPDVLLSFGGYVTVPVVLCAALLKIPIVIHEQTFHAGFANKIAARFATKICISWKESEKYFPKNKTILTGNPLRKAFLSHTKIAASSSTPRNSEKVIYITGGSGGAHGINVLIEGCLEKLLEKAIVVHQTGDAQQFNDFARLEKLKEQLPPFLKKRYTVKKFIASDEVVSLLKQADLVISRSGINTITELLYLGKPSLLIPLPYGQHNEQLTNAQFMQKIGLGISIDQLKTTSDELYLQIITMLENLHQYLDHKDATQKLIQLNATEKIIKEVAYAKEQNATA